MSLTSLWPLPFPKPRYVVALVISLPALITVLYFSAINRDDFKMAKKFIEDSTQIAAATGKVQSVEFGPWTTFNFDAKHSDYLFDVVSDDGKFAIKISLCSTATLWRVEAADIRDRNGKEIHISVDQCNG